MQDDDAVKQIASSPVGRKIVDYPCNLVRSFAFHETTLLNKKMVLQIARTGRQKCSSFSIFILSVNIKKNSTYRGMRSGPT
jgi:hypothetical protein